MRSSLDLNVVDQFNLCVLSTSYQVDELTSTLSHLLPFWPFWPFRPFSEMRPQGFKFQNLKLWFSQQMKKKAKFLILLLREGFSISGSRKKFI